jgi:hypothetical protein
VNSRSGALFLLVLSGAIVAPIPTQGAEPGDVLERRAENNRASDAPEVNPSPSAWLVIHGQKPATLEVLFDMLYTTSNPECQSHSFGSLMGGAPAVPQRIWERTRIAGEETEFTVRIPLDRFVPGSCKWRPSMLFDGDSVPSLGDSPSGFRSIAQFTADGRREMELVETCSRHQMLVGQRTQTSTWCFPPYMGVPKLSQSGATMEFTIKPLPDQMTDLAAQRPNPASPAR